MYFEIVLAYAESIGCEVHVRNDPAVIQMFINNGQAGLDGKCHPHGLIVLDFHESISDDMRAWVLLHELGHAQQWKEGWINLDQVTHAYFYMTAECLRIEEDADRRADLIATALGVPKTVDSEALRLECISSYRNAIEYADKFRPAVA